MTGPAGFGMQYLRLSTRRAPFDNVIKKAITLNIVYKLCIDNLIIYYLRTVKTGIIKET